MSKLKDFFICLGLFIFGVLILGYKMIISGDIPVESSFIELAGLFISILIYIILQYFYVKKIKSNLVLLNSILLIILLVFWLINLITAITYNYHKYDTISDIIGCISIIFTLGLFNCSGSTKNSL